MRNLTVVIFSKDRPAQLDLLLRSLQRFTTPRSGIALQVLFTASAQEYANGYDLVRRGHPEAGWLIERDFRADLLRATSQAAPLLMFLVDDDVFLRKFSLDSLEVRSFEQDRDILALSLRMSPAITHCYTKNCTITPPAMLPGRRWRWRDMDADWGYPMSLDGHVFRTHEIMPLLAAVDFNHPNSLESSLAARPLAAPYLSCFAHSRIVNIPANRVQDSFPNRHMSFDQSEINRRFLAGERIDLEPILEAHIGNAVHQEINISLSKPPSGQDTHIVKTRHIQEEMRLPDIAPIGPNDSLRDSKNELSHYNVLVRKFRDELKECQKVPPAGSPPSLCRWWKYADKVKEIALQSDPIAFLTWDVIREIMFVGNSPYVALELTHLLSLSRNSIRWKAAIAESTTGLPEPSFCYPISSGNLIHHAYHVARWVECTGSDPQRLDRILEIGGGYGSLCRLMHKLGFVGTYAIYDLPVFSALQRFYLGALGVPVHTGCDLPFIEQQIGAISSDVACPGHQSPLLFVATWSLSEMPISNRQEILSKVPIGSAFLLAFQERFEEVDNVAYFREFARARPQLSWHWEQIRHLPGNWYLFGWSAQHVSA